MENKREFYTVRGYQLQNFKEQLLTSSMEDYLEMIYRICKSEGYTRIKQLANNLNVRPPSATKIAQKLEGIGLVNYQKYGIIRLTEKGEEIGLFLLKRHEIVEKFLKWLDNNESLLKDTEIIEHDISIRTLENINMLNNFMEENPDITVRYKNYKRQ